MTCGNPSHIRKWFGPCHLSYGHGGSCEHPPLASLYESDGRCDKCGNDREAWDRAIAEIARLTAELAKAREVPADVEVAIKAHDEAAQAEGAALALHQLPTGDDQTYADYRRAADATGEAAIDLRATIARAIAEAADAAVARVVDKARVLSDEFREAFKAPPATVGGLLATAPVGSIVEWIDGDGAWCRMRIGDGLTERWYEHPPKWTRPCFGFQFSDIRLPARLVPAAEADRDPATRGPLPGGEG